MNLTIRKRPQGSDGYAIILAMVFAGLSLVVLTATVAWNWSATKVSERNNSYNRAVAAAEAGTEAVIAGMDRDFQNQSLDYSDLSSYRSITPASYDTNSWVNDYEFCDTNGAVGRASLATSGSYLSTNIDPQLPGLYGMVLPCRVISLAKRVNTAGYDLTGAVQQDFKLVSIPIYQFQCFYSVDLEINPGAAMKITGKVHGNADMYLAPGVSLEFADAVETVGHINYNRMPSDPLYGSTKVMPVFDTNYTEGANSLYLPIGTNNSPSEVVKVLDPPAPLESATSALGSQRFYNKVDLIVTTTSSGVAVNAGLWCKFASIPMDWTNSYSFIRTNATFTDGREGKGTVMTDIDVGLFSKWLTNTAAYYNGVLLNSSAMTKLGHQLNSIYVDDQRSVSGKLTAVRVVNGQILPPDGLTVATYRPVYVQGHFNAPDTTPALTDTSKTKPASLVGDSITVLSAAWNDTNTAMTAAADTTVNAAFLAGIVPTTNANGGHYSGGLENYPRLLEDWSKNGNTFTYNGSMVVMFPSRYATNYWPGTGKIYNAPKRRWAFDQNFLDIAKLPPVTPQVRKIQRGQYAVVAAAQ